MRSSIWSAVLVMVGASRVGVLVSVV